MSTQIVIQGNNLEILPQIPDASVDAVVTDPPYGLAFMGKAWDKTLPDPQTWVEALRVLKPGGHALIFGAPRLYHRLAVAVEDAGFEIRDVLMWMFGSGFPKSLDVSKAIDGSDAAREQHARRLRFTEWVRSTGATSAQIGRATGTDMGSHYTTAASQPAIMTEEHLQACIASGLFSSVPEWVREECRIRSVESANMAAREVLETRMSRASQVALSISEGEYDVTAPHSPEAAAWAGWGTALKPAYEPILLVRKPLIGTVAQNVLTHGTGGINVGACRVARDPEDVSGWSQTGSKESENGSMSGKNYAPAPKEDAAGRWPANVIMDEEAGATLDEQTGDRPVSGTARKGGKHTQTPIGYSGGGSGSSALLPADSGGASRFFYCPKASRSEREAGLEAFSARVVDESREDGSAGRENPRAGAGRKGGGRRNHHPTVKPLSLMEWCVRLITPPGGLVLDMFAGSGSTPAACAKLGVSCIGIELDPEYVAIGNARIAHWSKKG